MYFSNQWKTKQDINLTIRRCQVQWHKVEQQKKTGGNRLESMGVEEIEDENINDIKCKISFLMEAFLKYVVALTPLVNGE